MYDYWEHDLFKFQFCYRTAGKDVQRYNCLKTDNASDFLERTGIVRYPPPLHFYEWNQLVIAEQEQALKELQAINKNCVLLAVKDDHGGLNFKPGKKDEPKELRAWEMMSAVEREQAFNNLKVSH